MKGQENTQGASAFEASVEDGKQHIVGIGDLRVMLLKTETFWYAQGLEIDYAAQGNSLDEVKERFSDGLHLTIDEHLTIHGTIKHLLAPAPRNVWDEFIESKSHFKAKYSGVGIHDMFPFDEVAFYSPEEVAY